MRTATSLLGLITLIGCTAGCDFWGKEKTRYYTYCDGTGCYTCDPSGCSPTGGRVGGACTTQQQCAEGCYCEGKSGTCVEGGYCQKDEDCQGGFDCNTARHSCQPTASDAGVRLPDGGVQGVDAGRPATCAVDGDCDGGAVCVAGVCKPTGPCTVDGDCARIGAGLVCDTGKGVCASPPAGPACTCDCDCGAGHVCQNAHCLAAPADPSVGCTFNRECGSGQCVNSRCQQACSGNGDCGTGDVCQGGFCVANPAPHGGCTYNVDCGPGATCINTACHLDCTQNGDCKNAHDFCDSGICKPDWRRVPQCRDNSGCAVSEECVNAACRTHCWINADCGGCVDQPVCQLGYCVAQAEVSPMCTGQSSCAPGQSCVNATCK